VGGREALEECGAVGFGGGKLEGGRRRRGGHFPVGREEKLSMVWEA
jgi:hypothetical protein